MLYLESLLVRQSPLDVSNAHMIFVLIEIVVVLDDVALQFLLGHLLVEQELNVLLLEHAPLKLHRAVAAHPLDHDAIGFGREGHARGLLKRLLYLNA